MMGWERLVVLCYPRVYIDDGVPTFAIGVTAFSQHPPPSSIVTLTGHASDQNLTAHKIMIKPAADAFIPSKSNKKLSIHTKKQRNTKPSNRAPAHRPHSISQASSNFSCLPLPSHLPQYRSAVSGVGIEHQQNEANIKPNLTQNPTPTPAQTHTHIPSGKRERADKQIKSRQNRVTLARLTQNKLKKRWRGGYKPLRWPPPCCRRGKQE